MCYVQGVNRDQTLLLPEVIDEYVDDDNAVRFIDAYVDSLNLIELDLVMLKPRKRVDLLTTRATC